MELQDSRTSFRHPQHVFGEVWLKNRLRWLMYDARHTNILLAAES
jgi:hypothetical protein